MIFEKEGGKLRFGRLPNPNLLKELAFTHRLLMADDTPSKTLDPLIESAIKDHRAIIGSRICVKPSEVVRFEHVRGLTVQRELLRRFPETTDRGDPSFSLDPLTGEIMYVHAGQHHVFQLSELGYTSNPTTGIYVPVDSTTGQLKLFD